MLGLYPQELRTYGHYGKLVALNTVPKLLELTQLCDSEINLQRYCKLNEVLS